MDPGVRILLRVLLVLACSAMGSLVSAQDGSKVATLESTVPAPATETTQEAGTAESIGIIGRKLWFEVRKRLNLTTEQEERQQLQAEQGYKLRIGGIKVEKAVEEPTP